MKTSIYACLAALLWAGFALAGVDVRHTSLQDCAWSYQPGTPMIERDDTVNTQGAFLEWMDAGFLICRDVIQPIRTFHVVVPPGTTPKLAVRSVRSSGRMRGMAGRPPRASVMSESPSAVWARLAGVENWRGYRLARVEVFLQTGDLHHSEVLEEISLSVAFDGTASGLASSAPEADLLGQIAVNGKVAAYWWQERTVAGVGKPGVQTLAVPWPQIDLYRLAVTETGLYEVTGSSVAGSNLVGQSTSKIRLFGNGGRLLAKFPQASIDSSLKEDAILVEDRNGNGIFDPDDRVLFFGRGLKGADYCDSTDNTEIRGRAHQSPYSTENIYWIGADPSGPDGMRMASLPATGNGTTMATSRVREYVDQDVFIFDEGEQATSGLIWYMATLGAGETRSFAINLESATGSAAQLVLGLQVLPPASSADPFRVWVGDTVVAVNGYQSRRWTMTIPQGVLAPGANIVRLENNSSATVYVNFIEIGYDRTISAPSGSLEFLAPQVSGLFRYSIPELDQSGYLLDVSNPLAPRVAIGNTIVDSSYAGSPRRYFVTRPDRIRAPLFRGTKPGQPSDLDYAHLRDPNNHAQMIILTYDEGYDLLDSLKRFHETYREEPMPGEVMRVRLTDVYDEFGWGVHDIVAIRNFLKYAYEMWQGPLLKYVLLVGAGDYDYRNLESTADANWMPPWEDGSECRDDFYGTFQNDDGYTLVPVLRIGRWPVRGNGELQSLISKTIAYGSHPLYGPWKNTATFAADDEWKNGGCGERFHSEQAESLISTVLPQYFTFKKIYEILYPFRSSSLGAVKPDATQNLIESINRGTLVVNFTGHGNATTWTDEQLFVMDRDKSSLHNGRMWPLYLAATCSWGQYDRPVGRCFPEILLADPAGGSVMCVAATRFTYVGSNTMFMVAFYQRLFPQGISERRSFGEALVAGKVAFPSGTRYYHCLGDPALRLATPEFYARVTPSSDDTLQALSLFHVRGEVSDSANGEVWSDFHGIVEARVYDTQDSAAYYWCGNTANPPFYYGLPGNAIFRGTATVDSGRFNVTFRVPRDIRFGGSNAKISLYFYGTDNIRGADSADGIGIQEHLAIAPRPSSEQDSIPPTVNAWLEVPSFRPGDLVSATPKLHVSLADSSGINLSGEVGHKITGRIDDAQTEDLTPFFNYDLDRHTTGGLDKTLGPLTIGPHRLIIEAWDSFNNLNQVTLNFTVGQSGEAGYAIRDIYNWPNPMNDVTHFTYFLTEDGTRHVNLKIYTLSGKLVYEMDNLSTRGPAFNSNSDRPWDGRDREGHLLGNGVYFYRIKAEHTNGHGAEATGKLVIMR